MLRIIGIQRAERFSPNSVDNDRAILEAVIAPLGGKIISEDDNIRAKLSLIDKPDVVFSMARDAAALQFLHELEREGTRVINPPKGVQSCRRTVIDTIMRENDVPVPPREGSDEVIIMTDDGSSGRKGLVTDGVEEVLRREHVDKVVTIGPAIMMKFVSLLTKRYDVPTICSLNTIMVDGTGMCGACRVTVAGKTRFVCVDGPEFDAHQVDFDEMMMRLRSYN